VVEHGEFSARGQILDVFPMGSDLPYRINLLDEKVNNICHFDQETQRSQKRFSRIKIFFNKH